MRVIRKNGKRIISRTNHQIKETGVLGTQHELSDIHLVAALVLQRTIVTYGKSKRRAN